MKQKKRIWWTFNLWEADAFQQYLEEMALQGWFLENVGGSVMKFYRAQPEKRRYAALLVPGSSSLTGADSWKAEQFRKECQEAGWDFQCSGTYWQIFYTTDESVKLTGDMTEERQFLIQKSLCGSRGAYAKSPAAWNLHFLDGNLCAAVSMELWEYNGYKRRQAVSENESAAEGKL